MFTWTTRDHIFKKVRECVFTWRNFSAAIHGRLPQGSVVAIHGRLPQCSRAPAPSLSSGLRHRGGAHALTLPHRLIEPLETLLDSLPGKSYCGLYVPRPIYEPRQFKVFGYLGNGHGVGEILFIREDEQRRPLVLGFRIFGDRDLGNIKGMKKVVCMFPGLGNVIMEMMSS